MTTHTSATVREETPHANQTTRTNTIINALTRRAQTVLNDRSIDPKTRAVIRYGLETNDPWLVELVRRADAGEANLDTIDFSQTPANSEVDANEEKIEALAEMICRADDEPGTKWAALLVLMSTLENASHPKGLAIFVDRSALSGFDEAHSEAEERWITLGLDQTGMLLVVCHTFRGDTESSARLRLISAR